MSVWLLIWFALAGLAGLEAAVWHLLVGPMLRRREVVGPADAEAHVRSVQPVYIVVFNNQYLHSG